MNTNKTGLNYEELMKLIDFVGSNFEIENVKETEKEKLKNQLRRDIFKDLSEHNVRVFVKKNMDYGSSHGKLFESIGEISSIAQIEHKLNRLKNYQGKVTDESKIDTCLDLSNYALMHAVELIIQEIENEDDLEELACGF